MAMSSSSSSSSSSSMALSSKPSDRSNVSRSSRCAHLLGHTGLEGLRQWQAVSLESEGRSMTAQSLLLPEKPRCPHQRWWFGWDFVQSPMSIWDMSYWITQICLADARTLVCFSHSWRGWQIMMRFCFAISFGSDACVCDIH